ncbi:IPTL-CTERM sorting domain-containing protein [Aquimonas sp.]|jgi:hypothetical protein|uniref:IPTL-CTERM sorting domain-containing protein n=1 Tax=Aquimonas sp. TaxID=1872588 RepID=UPI0037C04543
MKKWALAPLALSFAFAAMAQGGARPGTIPDTTVVAPHGGFLPRAVITQDFTSVATAPNAAVAGVCALNQPAMAGWFGRNNASPAGTTCIFNPSDPAPFVAQDGGATTYASMNFNSTTGSNPISTWLVSPRVNFGTGAQLSFYFRSANVTGTNFADRIQVRLSTAADTGTPDVGTAVTDVGTFTTLLADINPTLAQAFVTCPAGGFVLGAPNSVINGTVEGAWCQVTINNAAGIPTTGSGRIAFRHFIQTSAGPEGANSNFVGIDTFSFDEGVTGTFNYTVSPSALSFSGGVGTGTATQNVVVSASAGNTGNVTLTGCTFGGANAGDFSFSPAPAFPIAVAPGASVNLPVRFTAGALGARPASLSCTSGVGVAVGGGFPVALNGTGSSGTLSVSAAAVAFANQNIGGTQQRTVTVSNTGAGPLTVSSISAPTAPFALTTAGSCGATPFVLQAGASCTLIYGFSPTTAGAFSSAVTISTNGGNAGVSLTGTGVNIPPAPQQVDTLSPWGLGLLAMLIGLIAVAMVRRRD